MLELQTAQRKRAKIKMAITGASGSGKTYSSLLIAHGLCMRRGITREQVLRLSDGIFIEKADNVLITGATGCGKSFLACALARSSCLLGYRTQYFSMNKFLEALAQARLDGSYLKWIKGISANKLLWKYITIRITPKNGKNISLSLLCFLLL